MPFTERDKAAFAVDAKIGILATVDPDGRPHVTAIATLTVKDEQTLAWGQFCEGRSKEYPRTNPKTGFLVLTPSKEVWRGQALWRRSVREGPDLESFNRKRIFRYNAYFGIHAVHVMELVEVRGPEPVDLLGVGLGTVLALAARFAPAGERPEALCPWSAKLLAHPGTMKFAAWVREDGFPTLVPLVPCAPVGRGRLAIAPGGYARELAALPDGTTLAVFGMNTDLESVLLRGTFHGMHGIGPAALGFLDIDWVYNPMPPLACQVYPPVPLEAVDEAGGF